MKARTIDIETIVKCYHSMVPTGHWFDRDTCRFFGCRLPRVAYVRDDGVSFFVTSEDNFDRTARLYTVRVQTNDGEIDTVGDFQAYRDGAIARRLARRLAESRLIG
jgi:hypothetical protein